MKTLDEWAAEEIKLARERVHIPIEGDYQLRTNCELHGRIGALKDLRQQIRQGRPL